MSSFLPKYIRKKFTKIHKYLKVKTDKYHNIIRMFYTLLKDMHRNFAWMYFVLCFKAIFLGCHVYNMKTSLKMVKLKLILGLVTYLH